MKASREPRWWSAVAIASALFGLAIWVAGIYVAAHFISKWW